MNNIENTVKEIPLYQQRVYDELSDLQTKYNGLEKFINNESFLALAFNQQKLLIQQQFIMKAYIGILLARIELF